MRAVCLTKLHPWICFQVEHSQCQAKTSFRLEDEEHQVKTPQSRHCQDYVGCFTYLLADQLGVDQRGYTVERSANQQRRLGIMTVYTLCGWWRDKCWDVTSVQKTLAKTTLAQHTRTKQDKSDSTPHLRRHVHSFVTHMTLTFDPMTLKT